MPSSLLQRTLIFCFLAVPAAFPQLTVLSERYDNGRTGANLSETMLNTTNVNVNQFGKLFTLSVDGSIYAQPLYVPNLAISGNGTHNVLYVATMNDKLYAFDADTNTGANASPLWMRDFTNASAGVTAVPITDVTGSNSLNIVGNVGIESTPVIDLASNTMYLVARTKESGSYFQRLHAVDIRTGADLSGSPAVIQGSVGGQTFDPFIENQRTSLALVNGKVLIAWASHEDQHAYHGWVMAYNASTLTQAGIFCTTPSGTLGGIWEAGWAPAIDAGGNAYFISGNGTWNGVNNFGESFLKFGTATGLSLVDWFTPDNWSSLNGSDADLGASGAMLIPGANLLVGGGKQSIFYLLNTTSLGHELAGNGQVVQLLSVGGGEIKGGPVYWNRSGGGGPLMYVWAANDHIKAYHFNGSTFDVTPVSQGTIQAPNGVSPGVMTLSANGSTAGTGILWASIPVSQDGDHGVVSGILRAFDANQPATELWNSRLNASRDDIVTWPKWCPPLIVNGKVYMGSFSNELFVFGLLSNAAPDFSLSVNPAALSVTQGSTASSTITVTPINGFTGTPTFSAAGLPPGVTASFSGKVVTFSATANATVGGPTNVTIAGTSGTGTNAFAHAVPIAVTVARSAAPDFSISVAPAAVAVAAGSTAKSTITVTPVNGFTGTVSFAVGTTTLPAGVTASIMGNVVTFTAAANATAGGPINVTITGSSGGLSHSAIVALTVTAGNQGGPVTATPVINANGLWFDDEGIRLTTTAPLTSLSIVITVQNTGGLTFSGEYNTIGGTITNGHSTTASAITFTYALAPGQTLTAGSFLFDAQISGSGTGHASAGDTFTVSGTSGGAPFSLSGHF